MIRVTFALVVDEPGNTICSLIDTILQLFHLLYDLLLFYGFSFEFLRFRKIGFFGKLEFSKTRLFRELKFSRARLFREFNFSRAWLVRELNFSRARLFGIFLRKNMVTIFLGHDESVLNRLFYNDQKLKNFDSLKLSVLSLYHLQRMLNILALIGCLYSLLIGPFAQSPHQKTLAGRSYSQLFRLQKVLVLEQFSNWC